MIYARNSRGGYDNARNNLISAGGAYLSRDNFLSHELRAKLNMGESVDKIRTRFIELLEASDSLKPLVKEQLLRWETELVERANVLIGRSLTERFEIE